MLQHTQTALRAAEYVRMSTDHQRYSTDNQRVALAAYAAAHGMTIVRTYADEGRSGLTLENRPSLQALLNDAAGAERNFDCVLVYDVSRWGRFQDTDESAYYEHLLRRSGVRIYYCAEPFENDGTPISAVVKSLKRAMAAEFSRELSSKVGNGKRRMAERGYRVGSHAGYGLRRLAISERGDRRTLLQRGERKAAQTDRVILVPGPPEEVATVRRIFSLYVHARIGAKRIATQLTQEGAPLGVFPHWYHGAVDKILRNEKYVGANVYGKESRPLRAARIYNSPKTWVHIPEAFEPVVDRTLFDAAQALRRTRERLPSNELMLEGLRRLKRRHGKVTGRLIEQDPELPSIAYIRRRLGKLSQVYQIL